MESNNLLLWVCLALLPDWPKKLASPSQPIRLKNKTNRDLDTRVSRLLCSLPFFFFSFSLLTVMSTLAPIG